jgi:ribosomal protein S18 acetylase RimI-like enzyme
MERASGPTIVEHTGERAALRPLFELAEDWAPALDAYIASGRVLVATGDGAVVGHLQLTETGDPDVVEIKNMAVAEAHQGRGIGRALVDAGVALARAEGRTTMVVATATADIGNLRFYQRLGFRLRSIERDAFTEATGYPPGIVVDGIPLRDRVWLDRHLGQRPDSRSATRASRLGRGSSRADSRRSAER